MREWKIASSMRATYRRRWRYNSPCMPHFFFAWASQAISLWIVLQTYESLRRALRGNPKALFISAGAFGVVSIVVALTMAELDIGHSFFDSLITFFVVGSVFIFLREKKNFSQ